MSRGVLGVLIGIPTLATVGIGGTYLGTGETWEAAVLRGNSNKQRYTEASDWTYSAASVPSGWKEYFECCCKSGTSCDSCATDDQGKCPANGGTDCTWKVKKDKFEDLKYKCDKTGRKVFWTLNKMPESSSSEFSYYSDVCFKETESA